MVGIRIRKLFGRFDYDIQFAEGGMTILTGPNGFGKSTILYIITAMAGSSLDYFLDLVFEEIVFVMPEGEDNFVIKKENDCLYIWNTIVTRQIFLEWQKYEYRRKIGEVEEQEINDLIRRITDIVYTMHQVVGEVYSIKEQRLIQPDIIRKRRSDGTSKRESVIIQVVDGIPVKLREKMNFVANRYSRVANQLDSTFPKRLFDEKDRLSKEEFGKKLSDMQIRVRKLNEYGISNIGEANNIQFNEEDAKALKVYFDDFDKKYQEYETLMNQLDLFAYIVNGRFEFKKMHISNEKGLYVLDDQKEEIPLLGLSSGEKEIIVLFYKLIFEMPDNVLLLIDEPEISLHIAWQRMFAKDIKAIIEQKNITALIATHSIQIVSENREAQVDLGQQYEERFNQ